MFETVELGNKLKKKAYKKQTPKIREGLLAAQLKLKDSKLSLVVIIGGVEGSGKTHVVNLLLNWLDARGIEVRALSEPTDEERDRPYFWRFWRLLPPKKKMGIFLGSWYTQPVVDRVFKNIGGKEFDVKMEQIVNFERMLVNEGTVLLKFWLHISKKSQKKRFNNLEKDPDTRWRVTDADWDFHAKYNRFRKISEDAISRTNTPEAPWLIIEATDEEYRNLTVTRTILEKLDQRLEAEKNKAAVTREKPILPVPTKVNVISKLDLTQKLVKNDYEKQLEKFQGRLTYLTRELYEQNRSMILLFEGNDAAGKGGSIRRLTQPMDARSYQVISIAAPTDEERARPYLWRFWRHIPRRGRVTIFDRSWYGRVLVERIEGFCSTEDWQRAFAEINDFEKQLSDFGIITVKFWLTISKDEQMRRFKEREQTPWKQYKITEEDWRNREKWDGYVAAACEMIERTSTSRAPWVLVESEDKLFGRIRIIKSVVNALEKELE